MFKYTISFDTIQDDNLLNYQLLAYDNDNNVVHRQDIEISKTKLIENTIYVNYDNTYIIPINDNVYCDDYNEIKVFINNHKLTEKQYSFSKETRLITLSYKVQLNPGDNIMIQYYKSIIELEVELEQNNLKFEVICKYEDNNTIGVHTIL